jgi:hypothetical protein
MLDDVESMAWRMLAAVRHGRPYRLVLAFAATLIFSVATNGWRTASSAPNLNGSIGRPVNDPCFHKGQKGVSAVNLTSRRTILDLNGDTC